MTKPIAVLMAALSIALTARANAQRASSPVAFTDVSVLAVERGTIIPAQTVVVDRGVITGVGPAQTTSVPAGATRVDGRGKFLIPGLTDVHVHLANNPEPEQRMLLQLFLAYGVTTVVNLRGVPQTLDLRAAVASGSVLGPTIYTAGPFINEPLVRTPDDVERAVVEQKRAGYDFVKLHGDLSREAYARLNAVARREGIRVIGHAPRNLGIDAMFEERQYAVAHAEEFIYDRNNSSRDFALVRPKIPELARRMVETRTWLMPNLTAYKIIGLTAGNLNAVLARPEVRYLPRSSQQGWGPASNPYAARFGKETVPGFEARLALLQELTKAFQRAGVRLLVGTDAMNPGVVPGTSTHDEMAELVTAGLTPLEALRAATTNAADFLTVPGQHGTIARGQIANLVLLDANPLLDIANTRRIAGVMTRGRWLSRTDIDSILTQLTRGSAAQIPR